MKIILTILICSIFCGCINQQIQVNTTKSWEGHFFTTNDFYNATKNIQLDKNESIWILSDKTLNTVLKNLNK